MGSREIVATQFDYLRIYYPSAQLPASLWFACVRDLICRVGVMAIRGGADW